MLGKFKIGDFVKIVYPNSFYSQWCVKITSEAQSRWTDSKLYYEVSIDVLSGDPPVMMMFYEEDLENIINDWGDGE